MNIKYISDLTIMIFLKNSRIDTAHPPPVGYWFYKGVVKMKNLKLKALVAAGLTALTGFAQAAVPAAVQTAIDAGTVDGSTIAYSLLSFAVVIGVIMFIKRKV